MDRLIGGVVCLLLLHGCGAGSSATSESIVGTWVVRSIGASGISQVACPASFPLPPVVISCGTSDQYVFESNHAFADNADGLSGVYSLNGSTATLIYAGGAMPQASFTVDISGVSGALIQRTAGGTVTRTMQKQ